MQDVLFVGVTRLIHYMCEMRHLNRNIAGINDAAYRDLFIRDATLPNVRHGSFIFVKSGIYVHETRHSYQNIAEIWWRSITRSNVRKNSFMCDVTHFDICAWVIRMRNEAFTPQYCRHWWYSVTRSYVWNRSFKYVTRLIHMHKMRHSFSRNETLIPEHCGHCRYWCGDVTHSYLTRLVCMDDVKISQYSDMNESNMNESNMNESRHRINICNVRNVVTHSYRDTADADEVTWFIRMWRDEDSFVFDMWWEFFRMWHDEVIHSYATWWDDSFVYDIWWGFFRMWHDDVMHSYVTW